MKSISAKELKNQTGKVLRQVGEGEKILITKRGKPWAVLSPAVKDQLEPVGLPAYERAWKEIEGTLKTKRPHFKSWQETMRRTRWRG